MHVHVNVHVDEHEAAPYAFQPPTSASLSSEMHPRGGPRLTWRKRPFPPRAHHGDVRRLVAGLAALSVAGCAAPPEWTVARDEPGAAALSVRSHAGELYVVGADDGGGPLFLRFDLRFDGAAWRRIETGDRGALWWVTPEPDGTLLAVGAHGRVFRFDPATESFTPEDAGLDDTLYGAWVAEDGTAWAVGGDPLAERGRGVMLVRRDGRWTADERVPYEHLYDAVLFKVWGTDVRDVWAVGERGVVLHFDGERWSRVVAPSTRLLTIHGAPGEAPVAVGGTANGVLLEWDGAAFADRMPPLMPGANGVFVTPDAAWAVGNRGLVMRRDGESWIAEENAPTDRDLHAVTVDEDGVVWAVGGALLSPSLDQGVVLRFGP